MRPTKKPSSSKKYPPGSFMYKVKKRKIIETLSAFIGGGFLFYEIVHWILVDHYHLPEELKDITIITILCAMLCTLTWQWFGSTRKRRKIKLEFVLIPALILITVFLDIRFVLQMGKHREDITHTAKWKNSIAVLPFVNISPEEGQDYFCDGITEELINRLSKIKELKVPARTSAFAFKGKEIDIREVGEKLNVDKVLEGSVRKTGNRIRITVQLINIADGYHIWSEQYDREMEDIFKMQDEISLMILDKLKIELFGEVRERVVKRYTDNKEAYDLYLRGQWIYNSIATEDDCRKAIKQFELAIEMDPNFSLAYVGLAETYHTLFTFNFISSAVALPKIKKALQEALKIDNTLAEAHALSAVVKIRFEWDWPVGEADIKKALELNPNSAYSHWIYYGFWMCQGQFDRSIEEALKAVELDPLSLRRSTSLAAALYHARRFDDAIEQCQKVLELDPDYSFAHQALGFCLVEKSLFEESISAFKKALVSSGNNTESLACLAFGYAKSGNREKAIDILEELDKLSENQYVSNYDVAMVYTALREKDKAFEYLELAYKDIDAALWRLKVDPTFDALHSDPRFKTLLKKIGFE